MQWLTTHRYLGTEFDWVASDSNGRLGYFSTAGFGGIPASVAAIDDEMYGICDAVAVLPERGAMKLLSHLTNVDDWIRVAMRGFFAYDWNHERDCYAPISIPTSPLFLTDLGLESPIRKAAELCRMNENFSGEQDIELR